MSSLGFLLRKCRNIFNYDLFLKMFKKMFRNSSFAKYTINSDILMSKEKEDKNSTVFWLSLHKMFHYYQLYFKEMIAIAL